MSAKRKHLKKLASLSALGAGAVALTAPNADAGIVSVTGLNVKVGFDSANGFGGGSGAFSLPGPGMFFSFQAYSRPNFGYGSFGDSYGYRGTARLIKLALGGVSFAAGFSAQTGTSGASLPVMSIAGAGQFWGVRNGLPTGMVGGRVFGRSYFTTSTRTPTYGSWTYYPSSRPFNFLFGNTPFTDQFALFRFGSDPAHPNYGWVELSYEVTDTSDPSGSNGPNLTILGYGYETTPDLQIAAGEVGGTETPEPSSIELSGLAALALGAEGVRRWRKARKAA